MGGILPFLRCRFSCLRIDCRDGPGRGCRGDHRRRTALLCKLSSRPGSRGAQGAGVLRTEKGEAAKRLAISLRWGSAGEESAREKIS